MWLFFKIFDISGNIIINNTVVKTLLEREDRLSLQGSRRSWLGENFCWGALLFQYTFSNSAKLSHSLLFSFAIMLVKIEIETTETERS